MENRNENESKQKLELKLTCTKLTIWTTCAMVLQIAGLSLFVLGFFPVKPALSGVSGPESFRFPGNDSFQDEGFNLSSISPDHLRSLYLVVDGLPAEFVLGKDGKPPTKLTWRLSLHSVITWKKFGNWVSCKGCTPNVTMPRLKAMVSGAIGGFLDVAFNFNTQAFLDDNLLGQFLELAGVKDTVDVDLNVSRHLPEELNRMIGISWSGSCRTYRWTEKCPDAPKTSGRWMM
ncbi:GPI ethanolamine phosphate transferase 2 [Bienertia sinuspersici]